MEPFLLTHPVWDVTATSTLCLYARLDFYSHIPCGMWLIQLYTIVTIMSFLLTHPVWDVTYTPHTLVLPLLFLLTHPVWDVTMTNASIASHLIYFYSHIPCGMWQFFGVNLLIELLFLLTHPVWDVTRFSITSPFTQVFLLTHPVWDVTAATPFQFQQHPYFYSHIPCGMWQLYIVYFNHIIPIYYRMDL